MIELEIYARGLCAMEHSRTGSPTGRDRRLRCKLDTNHDIVYLEFDEPTLSVHEIRAIFIKLGLQALFIGAIPPQLQSRTKTEPLKA